MNYQDHILELAKGGFDIVETILDDVMLVSVEKAHANSLEVFKDSFGVNHTLDCAGIGVNWVGRIWDRNNRDNVDFSQDEIEPAAAPLDGFTGQRARAKDEFDESNLMVANQTPAEMKQQRAAAARKLTHLGTDESMSSKSRSRMEGRNSPLSPRKFLDQTSPLATRSVSALTGRASPTNVSESKDYSRKKAAKEKRRHQTKMNLDQEPVPAPESEEKLSILAEILKDQEAAISVYTRKLKEQPDLAKPRKQVEEKILKRGQPGYRDSDVKLIDREKITDDQGKEIQLKKPNIDKIQKANPFFIHGKAEEKAKSPNMKIKKRRIKINRGDGSNLMSHSPSNLSMGSGIHENMMRVKVEQEIKELPGQVETFVGKPMFQKHYH